MANKKQYASAEMYEKKLKSLIDKMKAQDLMYNWDRLGNVWISFDLNGRFYKFEHSLERAKAAGMKTSYVSDVFAQLVLSLEALARVRKLGIFTWETLLAGMKFIEAPKELPEPFRILGFDSEPESVDQVNAFFRQKAKEAHPDGGNSGESLESLKRARDASVYYVQYGEWPK